MLPKRGTRAWRQLRARVFQEYADSDGVTWCVYCGKRPAEHLDHVVANKYGGQVVAPACAKCNLSKGAKRNWRRDWSI